MTLGDVLARVKSTPKIGDQEFVLDKHGVAHIVVVTRVTPRQQSSALAIPLAGDVDFMCLCEAKLYDSREVRDLEVAPVATCITCLSK